MSLRFADPGTGLQLELAGRWERVDAGPGTVFAAVSTEDHDSGFRPTVVVTRSITGDLDVERWALGTSAILAERLAGFLPLDVEDTVLSGLAARRLLASYVDEASRDLTLEQWCAVVDGTGLALSTTCATEDFGWFRSRARAIADSLGWEVAR